MINNDYYKDNIFDMNLRVVYYARVSTDSELQVTSIVNQISYFENYIRGISKWDLVDRYIDEGISGKNTCNRINFKKMIRDGIDDKYDLILTKSVSRFARNTIDSIKYTDLLKDRGIGIYFINDNINTFSSDSEFRLTLMASIAQDEIRKLSESVKFGLRQSIDRGVVLGNNNILGYKKDSGKLVIDGKEAVIVRDIFNLFITDIYSYSELAKIINKKYNRRMDGTSIKRVLVNYKYKGFYCGRKSTIINYKIGKRKNYDKSSWLVYRDSNKVPVIVKESVWDKANRIIINRDKSRNRSKYNICCIRDNTRCRYVVKKYKNSIYKYYICSRCFSIREDFIDIMVGERDVDNIYIDQCDEYLKIYIFF